MLYCFGRSLELRCEPVHVLPQNGSNDDELMHIQQNSSNDDELMCKHYESIMHNRYGSKCRPTRTQHRVNIAVLIAGS